MSEWQAAGNPLILAHSNTPLTTTSASIATLATYTLPGGLMGANDTLRITTLWTLDAASAVVLGTITFGGTNVFNEDLALGTVRSCQIMTLINNSNSTSSQRFREPSVQETFSLTATANSSGAVDTTADVPILFRGTSDGSLDLTLESYTIEILRAT